MVREVPPELAAVLNSAPSWRTLRGFVVFEELQETFEVQLLPPAGMVQLGAVMVAEGVATVTVLEQETLVV
jgi:hypothetical protein